MTARSLPTLTAALGDDGPTALPIESGASGRSTPSCSDATKRRSGSDCTLQVRGPPPPYLNHFSPAAGNTGVMSTGMSVSFAFTDFISAVSTPYFSSRAFARL